MFSNFSIKIVITVVSNKTALINMRENKGFVSINYKILGQMVLFYNNLSLAAISNALHILTLLIFLISKSTWVCQ